MSSSLFARKHKQMFSVLQCRKWDHVWMGIVNELLPNYGHSVKLFGMALVSETFPGRNNRNSLCRNGASHLTICVRQVLGFLFLIHFSGMRFRENACFVLPVSHEVSRNVSVCYAYFYLSYKALCDHCTHTNTFYLRPVGWGFSIVLSESASPFVCVCSNRNQHIYQLL